MNPRILSESALALRFEKEMRRGASHDARLRGLGKLARQVFVDRNANGWNRPGMPKGDRLAIKAEARPLLREAIHWVRKSRDALLAGNVEMHELLRDRARMYRAFAALEFFQPYANKLGRRYVEFAKQSSAGTKAYVAEHHARPDIDDLIRGCLGRRERPPVAEWVGEYGLSRSGIYRRIARIKKE